MKTQIKTRIGLRIAVILATLAIATLLIAGIAFASGSSSDISQCLNDFKNPLGSCWWSNGIAQGSNSLYFEGMAMPQRFMYDLIAPITGDPNPNTHHFFFTIESTKNSTHAYDWLTSYEQAQLLSQNVGGFAMTLNECANMTSGPTAECNTVFNSPNHFVLQLPKDPYVSGQCAPGQCSYTQLMTAYDALPFLAGTTRHIDIWGDQPITNAVLVKFQHVRNPGDTTALANGADSGDTFTDFYIDITSNSTILLFQVAGHIACGTGGPECWGPGFSAGDISGGPYHFKAFKFDGVGGSQDNQLQTSAIPAAPGSLVTQISKTAIAYPGGPVTDTFTVTGSSTLGAPAGTVNFYICGPYSVLPSAACSLSDPTTTPTKNAVTGNPVSLATISSTASRAVSGVFNATLGIWCFQADYIHSGPSYSDGSSTTTTNECVTVSSPTAVTLSGFKANQGDQSGSQVTLNWTTATEINTAGFNVYRSLSPDGPYSRINAQLIPAKTDALTGGKYQYVDANVEPGKTYYYQLEDVELNGTSMRHPAIAMTVDSASAFSPTTLILGVALGALIVVAGRLLLLRRKA